MTNIKPPICQTKLYPYVRFPGPIRPLGRGFAGQYQYNGYCRPNIGYRCEPVTAVNLFSDRERLSIEVARNKAFDLTERTGAEHSYLIDNGKYVVVSGFLDRSPTSIFGGAGTADERRFFKTKLAGHIHPKGTLLLPSREDLELVAAEATQLGERVEFELGGWLPNGRRAWITIIADVQHGKVSLKLSDPHNYLKVYSAQLLGEVTRDLTIVEQETNRIVYAHNEGGLRARAYQMAAARSDLLEKYGSPISLEALLQKVAKGEISDFKGSTSIEIKDNAFLKTAVEMHLYPHVDFNMDRNWVPEMVSERLLKDNKDKFKNSKEARDWLQELSQFIKTYSKNIFLESDHENSKLKIVYDNLSNGFYKTSREVEVTLEDGTLISCKSGWSTDGKIFSGKRMDNDADIDLTWKEIINLKEVHKRTPIHERVSDYILKNTQKLFFSASSIRILAENMSLLFWDPSTYCELAGVNRSDVSAYVSEIRYRSRPLRYEQYYYGLVGLRKGNLLYDLLVQSLRYDNAGKTISRDDLYSLCFSLVTDLKESVHDKQLSPSLPITSFLYSKDGVGIAIHPLDDTRHNFDQESRVLNGMEIEFFKEMAEEVCDTAESIGDKELVEYLSGFEKMISEGRVRLQMLFDIGGYAVCPDGQESTVVLNEIQLFMMFRNVRGMRESLKRYFIHEIQHAIDHEKGRLPPDAPKHVRERSAMVRTSAYYSGHVKSDGNGFVVFSKLRGGSLVMETTRETIIEAQPGEYVQPKEINYAQYEDIVYGNLPAGQLMLSILRGEISVDNDLEVTTEYGSIHLRPGWSLNRVWEVCGKNNDGDEVVMSWNKIRGYKPFYDPVLQNVVVVKASHTIREEDKKKKSPHIRVGGIDMD